MYASWHAALACHPDKRKDKAAQKLEIVPRDDPIRGRNQVPAKRRALGQRVDLARGGGDVVLDALRGGAVEDGVDKAVLVVERGGRRGRGRGRRAGRRRGGRARGGGRRRRGGCRRRVARLQLVGAGRRVAREQRVVGRDRRAVLVAVPGAARARASAAWRAADKCGPLDARALNLTGRHRKAAAWSPLLCNMRASREVGAWPLDRALTAGRTRSTGPTWRSGSPAHCAARAISQGLPQRRAREAGSAERTCRHTAAHAQRAARAQAHRPHSACGRVRGWACTCELGGRRAHPWPNDGSRYAELRARSGSFSAWRGAQWKSTGAGHARAARAPEQKGTSAQDTRERRKRLKVPTGCTAAARRAGRTRSAGSR